MKYVPPTDGKKLVIKYGGSLLTNRNDPAIKTLISINPHALIVPGGGYFADAVRSCGLDDNTSHFMAVLAMEQTGWLLSSYGIPVTDCLDSLYSGLSVLLPYNLMREYDPLPHSWDVTSDTIAAWVADRLSAPLLILKSIDKIRQIPDGDYVDIITENFKTDDLDSSFIDFIKEHKIKGWIINGQKKMTINNFFSMRDVTGTEFGKTFYQDRR